MKSDVLGVLNVAVDAVFTGLIIAWLLSLGG
jgi:hypothetical protein